MPKAGNRRLGWAGIAGAVLVVACCAGGPLIFAFIGSLALGALVGVSAGVCLLLAALTVLYARHRGSGDRDRQP